MTLLEKLDYLMEQNKINIRKLSQKSGLGYMAIRNWYSRGYENMSLPSFKILCDFFNVTMESMAYDDQDIRYRNEKSSESLNKDEHELLDKYDLLNKEGQEYLHRQADYATKQTEFLKDTSEDNAKMA